jgi:hypothetical protein
MLVPYAGQNRTDLSRHTGLRRARYSSTSWFLEVWLHGRYIGIAR